MPLRVRHGRLPLAPNTPMACDGCGTVRSLEGLEELNALTLPPIRHVAPPHCREAEYELICPRCGAAESFQQAIICTECRGRPCRCLPTMVTTINKGIMP